ncbi:transposable element Tcb2 transposase [Trichonephila clavipes]|nr:transposable element Tcb2 transposase [Trichonephila clavipes]
MSSRHHIDDFMRGQIIGNIEEGRKITHVARVFDIAHSVVSRLWKSFKTTGMCSRWHGGRVGSTTPAEDRYIVLLAKGTGAPQLSRQVAVRNYSPTNKNTLIRALIDEWDKLPQQLLDNVVQSMVRRWECCITLHGGHIPY